MEFTTCQMATDGAEKTITPETILALIMAATLLEYSLSMF